MAVDADAVKEFFINVGIPMQMVTDGHNSYVGRESDFYKTCRNRDVQLLLTEPGSSWQNKAEAAIRELKRLFDRVLKLTNMPPKLWDHLLEWCSDIRNVTALNIPELHGRTPTEKVLGYTPDISPYLDFMPWDPCWYVFEYFKNTKEFPIDQTREVGRWLGVSKNDADVVTCKILTVTGRIIHRADVIPWTEEERKDPKKMKLLDEFDEKAKMHLKDESVIFEEDDTGDVRMTEDDIKRSVLFHIANMNLDEEDPAGIETSKGEDEPTVVTPEEYDEHLQKIIKINHQGVETFAKIIGRKRDKDGSLKGKSDDNSRLDTRVYVGDVLPALCRAQSHCTESLRLETSGSPRRRAQNRRGFPERVGPVPIHQITSL